MASSTLKEVDRFFFIIVIHIYIYIYISISFIIVIIFFSLLFFNLAGPGLASHAGVFRGVRFSALPGEGWKTSFPKNACVGG